MSARVEGKAVFAGGRWLIYQSECEDFVRDNTPEGQFQWFIDIVRYLQFVTGENVPTSEYQGDEVNAAKARNTKDQYIVTSELQI